MFLPKLIDEDIVRWLKEDIPYWDVTTVLLPETKKESKARIIAKQEGIKSIPTIIFYKDGKKVETIIGAASKKRFKEVLDKLIEG